MHYVSLCVFSISAYLEFQVLMEIYNTLNSFDIRRLNTFGENFVRISSQESFIWSDGKTWPAAFQPLESVMWVLH